ncbi:hypothetical protein ACFLQ1_01690 [Candidatus Auribacterota bacterium]
MDIHELREYYQKLDQDELIRIAQNREDEYEEEAVRTAAEELKTRGMSEIPTEEIKSINCATVKYYLSEAISEINQITKACKYETLTNDEFLPWMEQASQMLSAAYNFRYLSHSEVKALPQEEWDKGAAPPKEIFKANPGFQEEAI